MFARSERFALGAVALWATLAPLGVLLGDLPPFFITGVGLLVGSAIALIVSKGKFQVLKVPGKTLLTGVYGLFGYHAALFAALQTAPSVQANLVNYLWPLLIVVLAPMFLSGTTLQAKHLIAGILGFIGAGIAITSAGQVEVSASIGFGYAFMAAIIWATYSLMTKRLPKFNTAAVGGFAFISGALALLTHFIVEPPVNPTQEQWLLLLILGLGPLGGAFYLWDYAIKHGDPQRIGLLSFLTPHLSTSLLLLVSGKPLSLQLGIAGALIIGAAYFGTIEPGPKA